MAIILSTETLRRFSLFASLDDIVLKKLASAGEQLIYDEEQWLFREGDKADRLYMILEGEVEINVSVGDQTLRQVSVAKLIKGETLGWSALVNPYRYQMGAIVRAQTVLAAFIGVRVCEVMTHHPDVGYKLMSRLVKVIGSRLTNLRRQLVSLIEGGQYQRVAGSHSFYQFEGGRSKTSE